MTQPATTRTQDETRSELLIQVCRKCGTVLAPLVATCSRCLSSQLEDIASTGAGEIVSSRVVHREVDGRNGELVPFTIAIVALDDGPWVYSWVVGSVSRCTSEPMRVRYVPGVTAERLPVFRVCSEHCGVRTRSAAA
ncbi:Zn-ribbon domain-containing OB-fold protein [Rhodococcus opacus]|uniref:Zn-ribbon domain-containing OB-fold protein n=1 Tax=Rhodococcus opacus TaxID=37919 RepID=UPI002955521A|nr:OB-fold domain-containing protein [Rhodococcus opacus]MDV7090260.1 OB-fold domain-containing protein [Rhodococcus opacus]